MFFWDIVENLLRKSGKTKAELLEYMGVSANTYNQWKKNKQIPFSSYSLIKTAEYFNVPVDYLLTGTSCELTEDEVKVIDEYRKVPVFMRSYVLKTIQSLNQ